tara:strand:+ start:1923 stop:2180 length:258 start_codon:yes stop_codon:yes gene_type:complete
MASILVLCGTRMQAAKKVRAQREARMGGQLNGESEALYQGINDLPIASPHGHCDPAWFSENENFAGPRRDWPDAQFVGTTPMRRC